MLPSDDETRLKYIGPFDGSHFAFVSRIRRCSPENDECGYAMDFLDNYSPALMI